ncbi:MAG: DUF1893 domain-containing protein [Erysipelotrichales bacterium]|nr:DUF1893 domain-containing protein [Erysipelotrichales bacterium]
MPKGTPHPELLLEEYAFVSIGPKGVFTGKDPANSPLEQWRKEGVPENSYMVLRKVDAKTAKLLLEGRAAAVYTDWISADAKHLLEQSAVSLRYRVSEEE